ncbi:MAG: universal stress protein [Pseudomonadota bacterium]
MEKKILITVEGSATTMATLAYVAMMEAAAIPDLSVMLFHVMKGVPPELRRESNSCPHSHRLVASLEERELAAASQLLDKAKEQLMAYGLEPEQVEVKLHPRVAGLARDILFEAERGLYDAVVLGRRGSNRLQEVLLGSVTNKVVQHADRTPVWVVGDQVTSHRVLCAVDGSADSLRTVDHMAFMLGGNPRCEVTLFHVGANLTNFRRPELAPGADLDLEAELAALDHRRMSEFTEQALNILAEGGVRPSQVRTVINPGAGSVSRAILVEARRGDYGTVVLGRRGQGQSFFLGHVSDRVVRKGAELAVWVVG